MRKPSLALCLMLAIINASSSSPQTPRLVCKSSALAALKTIPKLRYSCGGANNEWDEAMLRRPVRIRAIKVLLAQLEKLNTADWWETPTDDLNVCDFRRKVGTL